MRSAGLRRWLTGLAIVLLVVGSMLAPVQNARMVLERAAFALAYAMPDGTLPLFCGGSDREDHGPAPSHLAGMSCDACLLMAAPGLAAPSPTPPARAALPVEPDPIAPEPPLCGVAGAGPPPARAPPTLSFA
jgi:hypothetical protein